MSNRPKPPPPEIYDPEFQKRFWGAVQRGSLDDCWEWRRSLSVRGGYGQIMLYIEGKRRILKAHRVAFALANPGSPMDGLVCHRCNNPKCCNPRHLYLGDDRSNYMDTRKAGRGRYGVGTGEMSSASRLTWEQVQEIRASSESGPKIGARYGVSKTTISQIRRGITWRSKGTREVRSLA